MAQGVSQTCDLSQALSSEENFLYNAVLHLGDAKQLQAASSSIMSGWVYGGLVFIFIITYFCIWKGVRSAGRVVYFTATAPVVVLIILFGYNISLKGAGDGVKAYIGTWDFSSLDSPDIWTDAAGQIFFTLSVSMGIMTAYGSYVNPKSDLVMDHAIITGTNSLISIFAGFVVYAVLGNVVHEFATKCDIFQHQALRLQAVQKVYSSQSISLAFIAYPRGLANFPDGVSNLMGVLFFFTLINLGIDSLFSMVEGVTTVIGDTARFRHYKRSSISIVACGLAFLASTLFATDLGLYLLDSFDHFILTYGLQLVGMMQCVAAGWVYGHEDSKARVGVMATYFYSGGYIVACCLGVLLCGALVNVKRPTYLALAFGIPVAAVVFAAAATASFLVRKD
eukprot:CAMPEP_0177612000 /NCGR_PEP_ID=MMETSP0419_2-20121207/20911_1 /TAXON_ID=582737 /ORGANISM="Tetraselmis sp., Strain GSL018" /LENGTH=393 /DNA_ID=CAMNT_0019108007 /DNA_START=775 /DNA_END=1953 /DNA_ORIENTATION=-